MVIVLFVVHKVKVLSFFFITESVVSLTFPHHGGGGKIISNFISCTMGCFSVSGRGQMNDDMLFRTIIFCRMPRGRMTANFWKFSVVEEQKTMMKIFLIVNNFFQKIIVVNFAENM